VSLLDAFRAASGEAAPVRRLPKWSQRRRELEARRSAAKARRRRRNREASQMRARQRRLA